MKKLGKRLKQYSALAATAIAADASGQVVYTNFSDVTLTNDGDFFDIDLNSDGTAELSINILKKSFSSTYYSASISYVANSIYAIPKRKTVEVASTQSYISIYNTQDTIPVAKSFALNSALNSTLDWKKDSTLIGGYAHVFYNNGYSSSTISASAGQFPGSGDKFLAIRFDLNNKTHYGWARLDVATKSEYVTIKDFAYESKPNTPILAGDTGNAVGISEPIYSQTKVYAIANQVKVEGVIPANTEMRLYNIEGKLINQKILQNGNQTIRAQIAADGIYIVELRNEKTAFRKKLWLEKR